MNSISFLLLTLGTFSILSSTVANPLSRITNGDKAAKFQFPWHTSLRILTNSNQMTYCGGSLIAANFVLTAASCLRNAASIQVDIGSIELLQPFESQNTTQFLSHPEYNDEYQINNIAIIRLQTSVTFSNNVRAILLPRISESSELYESIESYVCGFGISEAGNHYLSEELLYAHKTVISNDDCRKIYDSLYIQDSVMCAVGFNRTTQTICYGDQGGALVSHIAGTFVKIGIASIIHPSGCDGIYPAGYTRVTPYLQWIASLTGIVLRP